MGSSCTKCASKTGTKLVQIEKTNATTEFSRNEITRRQSEVIERSTNKSTWCHGREQTRNQRGRMYPQNFNRVMGVLPFVMVDSRRGCYSAAAAA